MQTENNLSRRVKLLNEKLNVCIEALVAIRDRQSIYKAFGVEEPEGGEKDVRYPMSNQVASMVAAHALRRIDYGGTSRRKEKSG